MGYTKKCFPFFFFVSKLSKSKYDENLRLIFDWHQAAEQPGTFKESSFVQGGGLKMDFL